VKHRTAVLAIAAVLAALVLPELASACPMCIAGQGGSQRAFAIGSIFLSITPLLAIGGMVWYLRRRARAIAAAEAEHAAEPLPAVQATASQH
jgi:hypothetical protein